MDVTYRIRSQDLSSVPEEEVVRKWLEMEVDDDPKDDLNTDEIEGRDSLLSELSERKPLAESVFSEQSCDWYLVTLSEDELRGLEVVNGPENEGWRAVAKGGLIESIAERILAADDLEEFNENIPKSLEDLSEISESISDGKEFNELVVVGEEEGRPHIVDGNHRGVGIALHLLQNKGSIHQDAYVGIDNERFPLNPISSQ